MKFGLFGGATRGEDTADSITYGRFVRYVEEADRLGFESIFMVEHHFSGIGQVSATLNLLAHLAARTERIRLGTAVTVLPWHNPILLAEEAATVDLLSGGRLDFGVGKGYRDIEFKGFRIPKEEAQARFDEALALVLKAWTATERFSWHGAHWRFDDVIVEPAVVQKPHPPIWTGAGTPASIARVAASGFNLLLDQYGSFALTEERVAAFREACAGCGRPFEPTHIGLTRTVTVTGSPAETEEAKKMRAKRAGTMSRFGRLPGLPEQHASYADGARVEDDAALIGEPEEIIARLRRLEAMGVGIVLALPGGGIEGLRRMAQHVLPAFAGEDAARETVL